MVRANIMHDKVWRRIQNLTSSGNPNFGGSQKMFFAAILKKYLPFIAKLTTMEAPGAVYLGNNAKALQLLEQLIIDFPSWKRDG